MRSLLMLLAVSCGAPTPATITPIAMVAGCGSPDAAPDAPGDAAPDAPPDASVDWSQPWALHTIADGIRGYDGVDIGTINGHTAIASAPEEAGGVTLALLIGGAWSKVRLSPTITGYEDVKIGRIGSRVALVGASEANRLTLWLAPADATDAQLLAPASWAIVELAAYAPGKPAGGGNPADLAAVPGSHHFMQARIIDDGAAIVYGTRVEPASIGRLATPSDPANPAAWSPAQVISPAGWVMSLDALDVNGDGRTDLVVTDRTSCTVCGLATVWDLFGSRWLENSPTGWINHTIWPAKYAGVGDGSPKFAAMCPIDGPTMPLALVEVRGDNASPGSPRFPNTIYIRRNTSMTWGGTWSTTKLPLSDAYDLGTLQAAGCGDLNGDGVIDLVIGASYGHDDAQGDATHGSYRSATASNLAWLDGADAWSMHPLLGTRGLKVDNVWLIDCGALGGKPGRMCVVESEQGDASTCTTCTPPKPTPAADQLGVFWLENPR